MYSVQPDLKVDRISKARRSKNMSRIGSKNTAPEILVRQLLFREGYRYRLHRRDLPGKPDIVISASKVAIFIHGCFWHQHRAVRCNDGKLPKSNKSYWSKKLLGNVNRDRRHCAALRTMGWKVATIWECETDKTRRVLRKIEDAIFKTPKAS